MSRIRGLLFLTGRCVVGVYLLKNATNHFRHAKAMSGYAASEGVQTPHLAVLGSGALLGIAGTSLLLGRRPKVGIAAATAFFAGVTPKMHAYWKLDDPGARQAQEINFTKNLALAGTILALAAVPEPWQYSLDARRGRGQPAPQRRHGTDGRTVEGPIATVRASPS